MMEAFRARMYFYIAVVGLAFFAIFVQLANLQIVQSAEYKTKSRLNVENYIPIPASRGDIYDRNFRPDGNNVVLVSNRPSFNITIIPAKYKSKKRLVQVVETLGQLLKIDRDVILNEISNSNSWERIVLKEDVSMETIVTIASHQDQFPDINWEEAPVRVYNFSEMFAHSIGYIGSISRDEYKKLKSFGYRHYQKVGKAGVEKRYDKLLRGQDGFVRRLVDVKQRTEAEEIGMHPISGNNIVLTLDYHVQKAAFDAMKDLKGGVIALKPSTGEVLALVSKPDFDPNLVISKNNADIIKELNQDKSRPFLNRVIQSRYPPASTFKILTAVAGLETELTTPEKTYSCPGKYTLKGYRDHDFYCYETHGTLDLYNAIARSCSVYFYQLGHRLGPSVIMRYSEYMGLNEKSGIDIPGEIAGFIPSMRWKMRVYGQPWYDGDTINMSIGQGFLIVTPIGMCNLMAALVNNGIVYKPQLVREILSNDNEKIIRPYKRKKVREIPLSPTTLETVKKGMRMGAQMGTSSRLNSLKVPVAGKTGTAQTRSIRQEKFSQHAWFIGYGPYDGDPDKAVVVTVFVEYGVAGAASAVPVAERIFSTMYERGYFTEAALPQKQEPAGTTR